MTPLLEPVVPEEYGNIAMCSRGFSITCSVGHADPLSDNISVITLSRSFQTVWRKKTKMNKAMKIIGGLPANMSKMKMISQH